MGDKRQDKAGRWVQGVCSAKGKRQLWWSFLSTLGNLRVQWGGSFGYSRSFTDFVPFFHHKFTVESNSMNAISWISPSVVSPWRFYFYFNEINMSSSSIQAEFWNVSWMANDLAYSLAKQGVNRSSPMIVFSTQCLVLCVGIMLLYHCSPMLDVGRLI